MSRPIYFWHGEPVKTRFGTVKVRENKEKPLWWYNFECNSTHPKGIAIVDAIEVTYGDEVFIIANHFGIGVHKLKNGGWPSHQHFSLDGDFHEYLRNEAIIRDNEFKKFDEKSFALHEMKRDLWQKETYPEEFEKKQQLVEAFKNVKQ